MTIWLDNFWFDLGKSDFIHYIVINSERTVLVYLENNWKCTCMNINVLGNLFPGSIHSTLLEPILSELIPMYTGVCIFQKNKMLGNRPNVLLTLCRYFSVHRTWPVAVKTLVRSASHCSNDSPGEKLPQKYL